RMDALREERPLGRGREPGATAAAQPGRLHLLLADLLTRHREGLAQTVVATRRKRGVDRPRVVGTVVQAPRDDAGLARVGHQRLLPEIVRGSSSPRLYASTRSSAD